MEHHVGIDVSLELSSLCVLDAAGKVIRDAKVPSEPEALVAFLRGLEVTIIRVGLEAGPLSQWLYDGLEAAGFEVVLLETRHVKAAVSALAIKTDRRDAQEIVQLLRLGWYRPVHRKSVPSQEVRALFAARKQMQIKAMDLEQTLRGLLRGFGLKVGDVSRGKLAARIRELVSGHAMLERISEAMLTAREALWSEFAKLHREVLAIVKEDQVCRRLMTVPGRWCSPPNSRRRRSRAPACFGKVATSSAATPIEAGSTDALMTSSTLAPIACRLLLPHELGRISADPLASILGPVGVALVLLFADGSGDADNGGAATRVDHGSILSSCPRPYAAAASLPSSSPFQGVFWNSDKLRHQPPRRKTACVLNFLDIKTWQHQF